MLRLKSLTYTSTARSDLGSKDIHAIHETARHLNALDGVTGLLIFNGSQFLQVVEGAESAIDDLLQRLLADPRHSKLAVIDQRFIVEREFRQWAMELAQVSIGDAKARDDLVGVLPETLPDTVRNVVTEMIATATSPR